MPGFSNVPIHYGSKTMMLKAHGYFSLFSGLMREWCLACIFLSKIINLLLQFANWPAGEESINEN